MVLVAQKITLLTNNELQKHLYSSSAGHDFLRIDKIAKKPSAWGVRIYKFLFFFVKTFESLLDILALGLICRLFILKKWDFEFFFL